MRSYISGKILASFCTMPVGRAIVFCGLSDAFHREVALFPKKASALDPGRAEQWAWSSAWFRADDKPDRLPRRAAEPQPN